MKYIRLDKLAQNLTIVDSSSLYMFAFMFHIIWCANNCDIFAAPNINLSTYPDLYLKSYLFYRERNSNSQ